VLDSYGEVGSLNDPPPLHHLDTEMADPASAFSLRASFLTTARALSALPNRSDSPETATPASRAHSVNALMAIERSRCGACEGSRTAGVGSLAQQQIVSRSEQTAAHRTIRQLFCRWL
jgi:hypothetical protein